MSGTPETQRPLTSGADLLRPRGWAELNFGRRLPDGLFARVWTLIRNPWSRLTELLRGKGLTLYTDSNGAVGTLTWGSMHGIRRGLGAVRIDPKQLVDGLTWGFMHGIQRGQGAVPVPIEK